MENPLLQEQLTVLAAGKIIPGVMTLIAIWRMHSAQGGFGKVEINVALLWQALEDPATPATVGLGQQCGKQ